MTNMTYPRDTVKYEDCKNVTIRFTGGDAIDLSLDDDEYTALLEALDGEAYNTWIEIDSWRWVVVDRGDSGSYKYVRENRGYMTYHINIDNIAFVSHS